jgi:hypothetical protein
MISKLKYIAIGILVLLLGAAAVTANVYIKKYKAEKTDNLRLKENQSQILQENADYKKVTLTDKEFKQTITRKVDSLLAANKIKPKRVTGVIERFYYYRDTSYKYITPDPVILPDGTKDYPFIDTSHCFTIGGSLKVLTNLQPAVIINQREYRNVSTDIAYIERPYRFLFIKYGPWKARLKSVNTCGSETVKEIEVLKK